MTGFGSRIRCGNALASLWSCVAIGALAALYIGCADIEDRPAEWAYIHAAIIKPNCTTSNCHTDVTRVANISFDDREDAYEELSGVPCGSTGEAVDFVVAGEPEFSKLMYLLRGEEVLVMPPDVPLPQADIDLVEQWILEGAQCN